MFVSTFNTCYIRYSDNLISNQSQLDPSLPLHNHSYSLLFRPPPITFTPTHHHHKHYLSNLDSFVQHPLISIPPTTNNRRFKLDSFVYHHPSLLLPRTTKIHLSNIDSFVHRPSTSVLPNINRHLLSNVDSLDYHTSLLLNTNNRQSNLNSFDQHPSLFDKPKNLNQPLPCPSENGKRDRQTGKLTGRSPESTTKQISQPANNSLSLRRRKKAAGCA